MSEKFVHVKRIHTLKNSIFYSIIHYKNEILGFGRRYYGEDRVIKHVKLSNNLDIIEDKGILFRGEDPRCFTYKGRLYILDNYFNDMHLIDYETKKYFKINASGKNLSFIEHGDKLYFIHYIKPFHLYTLDINNGEIEKVDVLDDKRHYNLEYRGGTPAYKLNDNEYYGYGHRTYVDDNSIVKHDIFKWIVKFQYSKPLIVIENVIQPENGKNICDPTSVIELHDKRYLITAESDKIWFCDQDYVTNVYEIVKKIISR